MKKKESNGRKDEEEGEGKRRDLESSRYLVANPIKRNYSS